MDFSTEEGKSASFGEGLGFGLETGGGDLVKKLKRELCFAMCAGLKAIYETTLTTVSCTSPRHLAHTARDPPVRGKDTRGASWAWTRAPSNDKRLHKNVETSRAVNTAVFGAQTLFSPTFTISTLFSAQLTHTRDRFYFVLCLDHIVKLYFYVPV